MKLNEITHGIIGCAIAVHRQLGPGLLESAYEECMALELSARGWHFDRQRPVPLQYRGTLVDCSYRLDLIVEEQVIIELKAVAALDPIFTAQLLTYLKLTGCPIGLLINFNVELLKDGVQRIINCPSASSVALS